MMAKKTNFEIGKNIGIPILIEGHLIDGTPIRAYKLDEQLDGVVQLWLCAAAVNLPMFGVIILEGSLFVIAAADFRPGTSIIIAKA
jgi:hypothetical protein